MTSNTDPSGECSASSAEKPAWYAFNNNGNNAYHTEENKGQDSWIQYKFTNRISVKKFTIKNRYHSLSNAIYPVLGGYISGSNDGSTWNKLADFSRTEATNSDCETSHSFNNKQYYKYYRITCSQIYDSRYVIIDQLQFFGRYQK